MSFIFGVKNNFDFESKNLILAKHMIVNSFVISQKTDTNSDDIININY